MKEFKVIGKITEIEAIAKGKGIRNYARLNKLYGHARWIKYKGHAMIELKNGIIRKAELHWYQAHGIGKREIKRKRYLD